MTRRHLRRRLDHISAELDGLVELAHLQNRVLRDLSGMVAKGRDPRERMTGNVEWRWTAELGWQSVPIYGTSTLPLNGPPPPIDPDPELIDHLEGNRRSRDGYRRHAQEMHDEAVRLTEKEEDDWPPNDAAEMVYKRRAGS